MDLKKATISNVKWSFVETFSIKLINFTLTIILARLLSPYDFGVLAIVNVFYLITVSFIDGGLKEALIQKKDAGDKDYSSVFWINLILAGIVYLILYTSAPFIQSFYEFEDLALFIRIQAISLIIDSFAIVQIAKSTRDLELKKVSKSRIPASLISFAVGVTMAYLDFGILSLIIQQITYSTIYVLLIWRAVGYKPLWEIDFLRLKTLYTFGLKLFAAGYINRVFNQSMNFIYAKFFSASALGAYTKSNNIIIIPVTLFTQPILSGLYPTMVRLQDDDNSIRNISKQNIIVSQIIASLLCSVILYNTENIILILLGEKWMLMVPFVRIALITALFLPITSVARSIFKVKGKANLYLNLELVRKIFSIIAIFLFLNQGFLIVLFVVTLVNILMTLVDMFYVSKLICYSLGEQLVDLFSVIVPIFVVGFLCFYFFDNFIVSLFSNIFLLLFLNLLVFFIATSLLLYLTHGKIISKFLRIGLNR